MRLFVLSSFPDDPRSGLAEVLAALGSLARGVGTFPQFSGKFFGVNFLGLFRRHTGMIAQLKGQRREG
jgi:hypothetical protein